MKKTISLLTLVALLGLGFTSSAFAGEGKIKFRAMTMTKASGYSNEFVQYDPNEVEKFNYIDASEGLGGLVKYGISGKIWRHFTVTVEKNIGPVEILDDFYDSNETKIRTLVNRLNVMLEIARKLNTKLIVDVSPIILDEYFDSTVEHLASIEASSDEEAERIMEELNSR